MQYAYLMPSHSKGLDICFRFASQSAARRGSREQNQKQRTTHTHDRPETRAPTTKQACRTHLARTTHLDQSVIRPREDVLPRPVELDAEHRIYPMAVDGHERPHAVIEEARRRPRERHASGDASPETTPAGSPVGQDGRHSLRDVVFPPRDDITSVWFVFVVVCGLCLCFVYLGR